MPHREAVSDPWVELKPTLRRWAARGLECAPVAPSQAQEQPEHIEYNSVTPMTSQWGKTRCKHSFVDKKTPLGTGHQKQLWNPNSEDHCSTVVSGPECVLGLENSTVLTTVPVVSSWVQVQ